jgi:hypothetical protein
MLIRTFGKNFGREGISRIASIKALAQACSRAQKDRRFSGALAITAGRNLSTGKVAYRSIKKAFGPLTDMLPSDDKERLLPSNFIPKASDCSIFHISSHGFFNTRYPSCSLIDLASGSEDGSWSLADVVRELRFRNAPIVMMSACEVGTIGTDEGRDFIGFAGAFLDAGASACIGSRFKINEISTVIMLDRFYTALHNDITLNGFCRPGFALSTAIASVRSMTRDEIEIFFNEAIGEAGLTEEKATLLKDNKMTLYQFCTGSHPLDNDALWTGFSSYGLCVFPLTLAGKAS